MYIYSGDFCLQNFSEQVALHIEIQTQFTLQALLQALLQASQGPLSLEVNVDGTPEK